MPEPLQPAPPRRIIRNATWLVAWDQAVQSHVYRRDVDLTVKGDTVAAIGPAERADDADAVETDGRGFAVLPGFVDIHAHPSSEPMLKGLTDEVGSRQLYMSSLYEYLPLFEADPEGRRAATEVALCELMQSGVTTVCDLSAGREDWLDTLGASNMRVYAAPMFRSGRWYTPNGHEVRYTWDEQAGREGLDRALRVIDRARQHPSGRLDGVLYPAQVDTCTEALLRDSAAAARERRLPFQIHAAQSVVEFHEIMRRHSRTPIEWLREIGVLGANAIIGHAIFLDHHPWLHWPAGGQQQIRSPSRLQRSRRSPRYSPGSKRRPASPTGSARRRSQRAAGKLPARDACSQASGGTDARRGEGCCLCRGSRRHCRRRRYRDRALPSGVFQALRPARPGCDVVSRGPRKIDARGPAVIAAGRPNRLQVFLDRSYKRGSLLPTQFKKPARSMAVRLPSMIGGSISANRFPCSWCRISA